MGITLTAKQRDEASGLLQDHRKVSDALEVVGKSGWSSTIMLSNNNKGDVHRYIPVDNLYALNALSAQKTFIEERLNEYGIELVGKGLVIA